MEMIMIAYDRGQKIPEGYSLITLAQAEAPHNRESVRQACSSLISPMISSPVPGPKSGRVAIRLKNGLLRLPAVEGQDPFIVDSERVYEANLKYRLVGKPNSGEESLTKEDCLIALAYAAEHNDFDEVQALVEYAGTEILSTRMPFAALGTILHVCTDWASIDTLEKVLTCYPESVDVHILDRDDDTALHNLPNLTVAKHYDDCKRAACSLLGLQGVNANTLLSKRNNYGNLTALCKALKQSTTKDVCKALLDAGKEMEKRQAAATSKTSKADLGKEMEEEEATAGRKIKAPGHWLTLTAHKRNNKHAFDTALHLAVGQQYGDIVTLILEYPGAKGLNLTSLPDYKGEIPLHTVARVGNPDICSMLLKYSSDIDKEVRSENNIGETPLHIASAHGHIGVCEKLLEYGAPLDFPDKHGKYVLTNAFTKGAKQVVERILDACLPRRQEANTLEKSEEDSLINAKFEFGLTPLHVAVAISSEHQISNLLDAGAWVDSTTDDGRTPLHVATQHHDSTVSTILLTKTKLSNFMEKNNRHSRKLWINMRDISGRTALHNIVRPKDQSDIREEETGAMQINDKENNAEGDISRCKEESSAMEKIEFNTDKICEIVEKLLAEGAWVDVQDRDGETALHGAVQRLETMVVKTLLSRTTHDNFRSRVNNRHKWIAMCDFSGETALHEAAKTGCLQIVHLLLNETEKHADLLRIRDMENMTALDWAAQNPNNKAMIDEMMMSLADEPTTKDFLMWNLKEHIGPSAHKSLCTEYKVQGNQTSLLQNAVSEKDVEITRELINRGADVPSLPYNDRRWLAQSLGKKASDQPTSEDTLGRKALVQGVANLLLNPYTETPVTIGIFGSWGTGKSSFMLQVEEAMLYMVVKETFRKTPYNPSHDIESSSLKFSLIGQVVRCMVVKALKQCMIQDNQITLKDGIKTTCENQTTSKDGNHGTCGSADIENQMQLKDVNQSTCGKVDINIENQMTLKDEDDIINRFPMELQSKHRQLFRDLALTDRSKLVRSHAGAWYKRKFGMNNQTLQDSHLTGYTPAVLTLNYNAWQYDNKTEASAGLAVEISHLLESFMTPHQWLRMCWKYSWSSRPKEIFVQLLLPALLALVVVCVVLIFWKLVPIGRKYKALSLPMGIVGVMWAFFQTALKVIQPVTQTMLNNPKSIDHKSMLGYQHQVIQDINFLKDQLCSDANLFWKIVSFLGQLFISNNYFMEGTWIWKQHPRFNNFRIVVFIDDLDRCDEKTVLELLRATNLILGSCGINAVIGVDKAMMQRAINKEFLKDISDNESDKSAQKNPQAVENVDKEGTQEGKDTQNLGSNKSMFNDDKHVYARELADKYLQKIIQLPINMPEPSRKDVVHFLEGQVGKLLEKDKEDVVEKQVKDEGDVEEKQAKDEEDVEIEDGIEHGEGDPIIFHLILSNFTPMEKDMLKQLCVLTTKERGLPREWKRFLNYHRLAWTIISQDPNMKSKEFKGWQRKLILWIFICWNWRDQMDVIFEKWHDIISKSSKWQAQMHLQEKERSDIDLELGDIIITYMKDMGWRTKDDVNQNRGKQGGEIAPQPWIDLHQTLLDKYDIPMHFIEKFQQFRFYCKLNHLEIHEKYKHNKTAYSKTITSSKSMLRLGHKLST